MGALIAEARRTASSDHPKFLTAIEALEDATAYMLGASREDALAGAYAYLQLAGDVVGGMLLIQGGARKADHEQAAVLRFYARTILARAPSRLAEIKLGAAVLNSADFAA
jgi:hypothetical protein